ncbi:MAG: glycosyltransferase [Actinomycetota bacterium]
MRVLLWHGWLLDGSGSNVSVARIADSMRRAGHDVLLLCQEPHPEHFGFIDAWGTVNREISELVPTGAAPASGRVVLLRPQIGKLLPVFVYDEYEGFIVKTFTDLSEDDLGDYLERNVTALRTAAEWHRPEVVIAGHAVPGPPVTRRAIGDGFVAKVHGSDLEYALKLQDRYVELARQGLEGAAIVAGASADVLARTAELVPSIKGRTLVVPPGVEVDRFRPRPRGPALETSATLLESDTETSRGRPASLDEAVRAALDARDDRMLDSLASRYDQGVPDPGAASRLRDLESFDGPLIGYIGKLIAPKGVERLIEALALLGSPARGLIIGFGTVRERLTALTEALDAGDVDAWRWLKEVSDLQLELDAREVESAAGIARRVTFTGKLDHRYAPAALAALDVLVVPSTLPEAFGIVSAEGAAVGALPLVARHTGLAEVATALENEVGRPGLFSFEPGDGATRRVAEGITRLLSLSASEKNDIRSSVSAYVAREWSWERAAQKLLDAAAG